MSSFSLRKLEEARAYIYRFPKPTQKAAKFDYTWRILANWEQGGNHQTSLDEEIGDPEDVEMVDSRQYMEGFRDDCNEFMEFS
ncbi:BnaC02g46390D [Brassica napus]|nr:BnaC02g46390D [Brassica napus]